MNCLNASGQSALDIARFWNHSKAASELSQHKVESSTQQINNYYSRNPLYRASDMRKDTAALEEAKNNVKSKFVLFSHQKPFLVKSDDGHKKKYKCVIHLNICSYMCQLMEEGNTCR